MDQIRSRLIDIMAIFRRRILLSIARGAKARPEVFLTEIEMKTVGIGMIGSGFMD